uniref:Uncharacterized protein n=1 Tax=Megaselia scalaris TaxID=36166 RepID=T1GIJ4_MEGSC
MRLIEFAVSRNMLVDDTFFISFTSTSIQKHGVHQMVRDDPVISSDHNLVAVTTYEYSAKAQYRGNVQIYELKQTRGSRSRLEELCSPRKKLDFLMNLKVQLKKQDT